MEKVLGTSLIVCCLEVLPLRPFTFFVYCRMRSLILGLWVGKEKTQKKKMEKKSRTRGPSTVGIITCGAWKWRDVVKIKHERWKKMTKHWLYCRVNWQCFQIMCNYLLHYLFLENAKNLSRSNEAIKRSKTGNSLRGQTKLCHSRKREPRTNK